MQELIAQPLTKTAFAAFGEVIDLREARQILINDGRTIRFHDLFTVDAGERPIVSVFRTKPLPLPHQVRVMERHPKSSQAFMPMDDAAFLVLVANADASDLSLFITDGKQGVNLRKNVWHHPHIVLDKPRDFIVVDRAGDDNLEEIKLRDEVWIPATVTPPK